jgi:arginine utilization protein RocB
MWGDLYSIDFNVIEDLNIPSVIYGPWGKDYHQMTERVNIESLTIVVPQVLEELIKNIFNN